MPRFAALVLVLVVVAAAACGGSPTQGPSGGSPTRLTISGGGVAPAYLDALTAAVARESHGRLELVDRPPADPGGDPPAEAAVLRDVAGGKADLAILPLRTLEATGDAAVAPFDAPFLIPSVDAERRLVTSRAGELALASMEPSVGVAGLALLPGPLRRPLGFTRALIRPADYAGRFAVHPGVPSYDAGVRLLGGTPVGVAGEALARQIVAGQLDGAELDVGVGAGRNLLRKGTLTANVVMFAKMLTLVASPASLARLDADDRAALRRAVAAVPAGTDGTLDESAVLGSACATGLHLAFATAGDVATLRGGVAPLWREMAADAVAGPVFAAIRSTTEALPMSTAIAATTCAAAARSVPAPGAAGGLADGTYRTTYTYRQARVEYPQFGSDDWGCTAGVFTLRLRGNRFHWTHVFTAPCSTGGRPEQIDGDAEVVGDQLRLTSDVVNEFTQEQETSTCRWRAVERGLELTAVDPWDGSAGVNGLCAILGADPRPAIVWRRIAG